MACAILFFLLVSTHTSVDETACGETPSASPSDWQITTKKWPTPLLPATSMLDGV